MKRVFRAMVPWPLHEDAIADQKIDQILRSQPARWLNLLAGMPSTRWLAILRPQDSVGRHFCCGPTRREVEDLGRVICELLDEDWLQYRYTMHFFRTESVLRNFDSRSNRT